MRFFICSARSAVCYNSLYQLRATIVYIRLILPCSRVPLQANQTINCCRLVVASLVLGRKHIHATRGNCGLCSFSGIKFGVTTYNVLYLQHTYLHIVRIYVYTYQNNGWVQPYVCLAPGLSLSPSLSQYFPLFAALNTFSYGIRIAVQNPELIFRILIRTTYKRSVIRKNSFKYLYRERERDVPLTRARPIGDLDQNDGNCLDRATHTKKHKNRNGVISHIITHIEFGSTNMQFSRYIYFH